MQAARKHTPTRCLILLMFIFKGSQISSLTEFVEGEVVGKAAYGVRALVTGASEEAVLKES